MLCRVVGLEALRLASGLRLQAAQEASNRLDSVSMGGVSMLSLVKLSLRGTNPGSGRPEYLPFGGGFCLG